MGEAQDVALNLIEVCAKLCDREARICNGQKDAAKGFGKQIHVGGECIALSLAAQIRELAAQFTSAAKETSQ